MTKDKTVTDYQKFLMTEIAMKRVLELFQYGAAKTPIPDIRTLAQYPPEFSRYSPQ
jgi:hypothetical protein